MLPKKRVFSWREAIQQSNLKPTTRLVLFNLSIHMNDHGESCYPSIETQMEETGLSNTSVIDNLKLAVEAGFLVKNYKHLPGQKWKRSEYFAVFPAMFSLKRAEDFNQKGGEPNSFRSKKGGEPAGIKVVKEVHSNSSLNSPIIKTKGKRIPKLKVDLLTWEQNYLDGNKLNVSTIANWVKEQKFCPVLIAEAITEFRISMQSKGTKYANFAAAFQNYVNMGYLSKKKHQLLAETSPHKNNTHTQVYNRGGAI